VGRIGLSSVSWWTILYRQFKSDELLRRTLTVSLEHLLIVESLKVVTVQASTWGLDFTVSVARFWGRLVAVVDLDYSGILPLRPLLVLVLFAVARLASPLLAVLVSGPTHRTHTWSRVFLPV